MPIQRPLATILPAFWLAVLLASQFSAPAQSTATSTPTAVAAKDFHTHLGYQMARIDGKFHPVTASRPAHIARTKELRPELDKFNIDTVRLELKQPSPERTQIIRLLKGYLEPIPQQILSAEAKRVRLDTMRDDETIEDEKKPPQEVIDRFGTRIDWLRQRQTLFNKELSALTSNRTTADSTLDSYYDLIALEEAKLQSEYLASPEKQTEADAIVKLLSGRLEGKTVASVRTKLPREQLGRAIEEVGKNARPLPDLLRSPAYAAADQQKYLTTLQQFYKAEIDALQSLYEERSRLNKK